MSFAPFAAIWLLLAAAAGVALFAERRPKVAIAVTTVSIFLATALWYLFRPEAAVPSLSFAGRQWAVGEAAWHLTGIVLLLCATVVATTVVRAGVDTGIPYRTQAMATALGLSVALLPAVWAADDRTRLMGVALFAAAWALMSIIVGAADSNSPRFTWRGGGLPLVALFLLWAAFTASGARFILSVTAAVLLIIAGALADSRLSARFGAVGVALHGFPIVVGAAILSGPLGAATASTIGVTAGTAAGVLSLLLGLAWVWDQPAALARGLALALGGVVLVAAVWAGQSALLAATRLAIFTPALIAVAWNGVAQTPSPALTPGPNGESRRGVSPQLLALLVAYLAVAGLPLMVGFGALAPVYESWSGVAGLVLLVVTVVLLSLWLAAIYQIGRATARIAPVERAGRLHSLALLPPFIGLISLNLVGLDVGPITWVAIAVPAVAGVALGRFIPDMGGFGGLLREAAALPQPLSNATARIRGVSRLVAGALADALAILEGENGLIWILGLMLLIIWIT